MLIRTTNLMIHNQAIDNVAHLTARIALFQKQISSGVRLHRPSDDPVGFRQANVLEARLRQLESETFSVQDANAKLNHSVSQLTEANNLLTTAKNLAQQGVQALSQSERQALAIEVQSLLDRMQGIALSNTAGIYLYGGTRSQAAPFAFAEPAVAGGTFAVNYLGSAQPSQALIGNALSVDTLYAGNEIFGAGERQATIVTGTTGARSGQGTDTMVGRATLQVRHTQTIYAHGSGITAGTDSDSKDTVIGPAGVHSVEIIDTSGNGSAGTISLNGGPAVAFTSSDTNLVVRDLLGRKVHVNTTNINAGFNGTITLIANGTVSVDGGLTSTAINYSDSQTLTDSSTGRVAHIDTRAITRTGDDYLDFPGTANVFQVLYELTQDLLGTRELTNAEYASSLNRRIEELDFHSQQLLDTVGQQSASLASLRQIGERIQDVGLETKDYLIELQATDVAEAVLYMKNDQSLLEYTYAITAQLNTMSLISFLR